MDQVTQIVSTGGLIKLPVAPGDYITRKKLFWIDILVMFTIVYVGFIERALFVLR
jgi:hypothetical protein